MKRIIALAVSIAFLSCTSDVPSGKLKTVKDEQLIIHERIDGPANIRDKPNGDIIIELFDNVLIDAAELDRGWHKVFILAELENSDYVNEGVEEVTIKAGRPIIQKGDTVGMFKKDMKVRTYSGRSDNGVRVIRTSIDGFTHKENIKQNTIIERAFENHLVNSDRSLSNWKPFIKKFDLDVRDDVSAEFVKTFSKSESVAEGGPSPGPRMLLLFDEDVLVGVHHARNINLENTKTIKLDRYGYISFFKDYSTKKRDEIIDVMNYNFVNMMN